MRHTIIFGYPAINYAENYRNSWLPFGLWILVKRLSQTHPDVNTVVFDGHLHNAENWLNDWKDLLIQYSSRVLYVGLSRSSHPNFH